MVSFLRSAICSIRRVIEMYNVKCGRIVMELTEIEEGSEIRPQIHCRIIARRREAA